MPATITAVAHYAPPKVVTNKFFESYLDTTDEWITSRSGIKERRYLEEGATSDLIVPAAQKVLEMRGLKPEDIDCIIVTTVTPDHLFPSTACTVQRKLGLKNAWGFDLSAACSGFMFGLVTATQIIEAGNYKNVLLCGADKMTSITDFNDRSQAFLFGDAAGVVLLEKAKNENTGIIDYELHIDGEGEPFLNMKAGGSAKPASHETVDKGEHYLYQDGQVVFKAAVKAMADITTDMMKKHNLTGEDLAWFVPHQANMRIITATGDRMGLSKDKVVVNIDRYGNTTSATIPSCLSELHEQGKLKKGDKIMLASFGAGYTWGSIYIIWDTNE